MADEEMKKEEVIPENQEETDDVVEFVYNADGEEDLKATLKKLRKDLKEAKAKEMEYLTNWQRERADFTNYKKEEGERGTRVKEYAYQTMITDLLPALDAYDMAFANKEAWEKVDKNWRMGVEYIHQQILKTLADYGVSQIETKVGDVFDHNIHESIETLETNEKEKDHTIAGVTQSGYKLKDRIIRPARVTVFGFKE